MRLSQFLKNRKSDGPNVETWLTSDEPAKQNLAKETLARMDSYQRLAYLLSIAHREEKAIGKRPGFVVFFVAILVIAASVLFQEISRHHTSFPVPLFLMVNPVIAYLKRPTKLRRRVNVLLAEQSDVSITPVIVKTWMQGGYEDLNVPAKCIARLLPQMNTADDAAMLDKTQWAFLMNWLSPRGTGALRPEVRGEFVRAILLACGNLEKTDALPRVKRFAEAKSKDAEVQQLQQTARNYISLLEDKTNMLQTIARR